MHEYFSDDLKYVADAIVETRPAWDEIDTKAEDDAIGLPYPVIERLAITHRRMKEEPGFTGFRELIHTLSTSERPDERALATMFKRFKDLLVTLAEADVEPFLARRETAIEIIESTMRGGDWQAVDSELRYLQHSAERYWRYASNVPPAQRLSDRDLNVLQSVAKTINREGHNRRIQECQSVDGFKNRAYDKMQMLLEVLDNLNLLR